MCVREASRLPIPTNLLDLLFVYHNQIYQDTRSWLLSIDMLTVKPDQCHLAFGASRFVVLESRQLQEKNDVDPAFHDVSGRRSLGTCIIPHSIAAFLSQATTFSALVPLDFHSAVRRRHTRGCHVHARADIRE